MTGLLCVLCSVNRQSNYFACKYNTGISCKEKLVEKYYNMNFGRQLKAFFFPILTFKLLSLRGKIRKIIFFSGKGEIITFELFLYKAFLYKDVPVQ